MRKHLCQDVQSIAQRNDDEAPGDIRTVPRLELLKFCLRYLCGRLGCPFETLNGGRLVQPVEQPLQGKLAKEGQGDKDGASDTQHIHDDE